MKTVLHTTLILLTGCMVLHGNQEQIREYKTQWGATKKLGLDLYTSLSAKHKPFVHVEPLAMEAEFLPAMKLSTFDETPGGQGMVYISIGFMELMNNVAHAKAIDKIRKGYFQKYIISLALETGETSLKDLPDLDNPAFWSEEMMNEQLSNFNQMVGSLSAIKLSHFYLGHYKKYASQISGAGKKRVPINTLLTTKEWDESLKEGIMSGLNCGFGTDGILALFEAIEKMKVRPEWTEYFMPKYVKTAPLRKQFYNWEKDFFGGK